jgi:hypothetical protein
MVGNPIPFSSTTIIHAYPNPRVVNMSIKGSDIDAQTIGLLALSNNWAIDGTKISLETGEFDLMPLPSSNGLKDNAVVVGVTSFTSSWPMSTFTGKHIEPMISSQNSDFVLESDLRRDGIQIPMNIRRETQRAYDAEACWK